MGRIPVNAFGLFWPGAAAVVIGRKACERLESRREVRGQQEGLQRRLQMVMALVVIRFHGRGLECAVHPCHVAIRPRLVGVGQPLVAARRLAAALTERLPGVSVARAVGGSEPVSGQYRVHRARNRGHQRPEALSRTHGRGFGMELGIRNFPGPVQGDNAGERTVCRADRGEVAMAVAAWRGLALRLARLLPGHVGQAAEAMPLEAALPCRSRHGRPRGVPGLPAVLQRQERLRATRAKQRFCLSCQSRRAWVCRAHGGIGPLGPLLPLRPGCGVPGLTRGQLGDALLTLLNRATHRRSRAGAAVESLSQRASREGKAPYLTPSHPGTKQLERFSHQRTVEVDPQAFSQPPLGPHPALSRR
jgi:hypothetical protein